LVILDDRRVVLLPGDCGYQHIPVGGWDAVVGTHHGGRFKGPTPQPSKRHRLQTPPLLLSYGKGNTYKHPKSEATRKYGAAGWHVASTGGEGDIELVVAGAGTTWTCGCMPSVARRLELK
jgi:competence protein ComEC